MYLEREKDYTHIMLLDAHLHFTREALLSMIGEDDPLSFAQACFFMFLECIYNHDLCLAKRYMNLVADTIKRYDIRFVPRSSGDMTYHIMSPPRELTEDVYERTSFLCEVLHSEVDLVLLTGGTEGNLPDLYRQFTDELPVGVVTFFFS
jgi:hypothetical protein